MENNLYSTPKKAYSPLLPIVAIILSVVALIASAAVLTLLDGKNRAIEERLNGQDAKISSLEEWRERDGNYDIDVSYFDGFIPGATFHITLEKGTRVLTVDRISGCSLLPDECKKLDLASSNLVVLTEDEYNLVKSAYQRLEADRDENAEDIGRRDLSDWTSALLALLSSDDEEGSNYGTPENDDWEKIKVQDTDDNGVISGHEFAVWALTQISEGKGVF